MDNLKNILYEELNYLDGIVQRANNSLEVAPEGRLKVAKNGNRVQYYKRVDASDSTGIYIRKEQHGLAKKLAQKEYDKQVIDMAKRRIGEIKKLLKSLNELNLTQIYTQLSEERKNLITPYILTDEQFIKQWEERVYTGKGFLQDAPEIYTEKGERVRSKSEKILADKLNIMGIPYHYEYPLKLKGYGIIYPDFLVLNKRTRKEYYLEHFGLMDNVEYCNKAIKKLVIYNKNGIFEGDKLLITYETSSNPLNMKCFDKILERYLI